MKSIRVFLSVIFFIAIGLTLVGCNSSESKEVQGTQAVVTRGNISLDISAAGNLEYSTTQDLTFELFYAKGTVGEVNVEAGDIVEEGQVMASIDASEWEDQIQSLTDTLTAAQRQVNTKERALDSTKRAVTTKEQALVTAQRLVATKEESVKTAEREVISRKIASSQAQLNLETTQYTLDQIPAIKEQQEIIDNATYQIQFIEAKINEILTDASEGYDGWVLQRTLWKNKLTEAQEELRDILSGASLDVTTTVAILVKQKQLDIETAQLNLEKAAQAVKDAEKAVETAKQDVKDAEVSVEYAQDDLINAKLDVESAETDLAEASQSVVKAQNAIDEAKAASPDIVAPFDGFISAVNIEGGDEVLKGTVAIQIADPHQFQADIFVSEMDIPQVAIGGDATVSVSALSGISFPAKVVQISPTATIQSGVVNYSVKVELNSESILRAQSDNSTSFSQDDIAELPPMLQRAVESGRLTLEQAQELAEGDFSQSEGFTPPESFTPREGSGPPEGFSPPEGLFFGQASITVSDGSSSQSSSQLPSSMVSGNIELKQGFTVTISLIVAQRNNVLVVPTNAVLSQGGKRIVQVVTSDGSLENREVETGLSDWLNTEITSGLNEGEAVFVPSGVSSTSSSNQQQRGGGAFFMGR